MKSITSGLSIFIFLILVMMVSTTRAQAVPILPSSFYGTVQFNGKNVADGTAVEAVIAGQVVAKGLTQTYQGNSVYTLDVPSDDSSTAGIKGGKDGDEIQFRVGNVLAKEVGTWHSGTDIQLNLTVQSAATPAKPESVTVTVTPVVETQEIPTRVDTASIAVSPTVIPDQEMTASVTPVTEKTSTFDSTPSFVKGGETPASTLEAINPVTTEPVPLATENNWITPTHIGVVVLILIIGVGSIFWINAKKHS